MSIDLHGLLDDCAPRPRSKINVESVMARGHFLRWRRRLAIASLATLVALAGWGVAHGDIVNGFRPSPAGQSPRSSAGVGVFDVSFGDGAVWALTCDRGCSGDQGHSAGRVLHIDPASGRILASVTMSNPSNIAVGEGGVWVSSFEDDTVTRIDPATSRVVATIKLKLPFAVCQACSGSHDFLPYDLAVGAGAVWVATGRGVLARIDPATNEVATMIRLPGDTTGEVAVGAGAVWVTESVLGVYRIDPSTNAVDTKITVDGGLGRRLAIDHVIVGGGDVFVQGTWARESTDSTGGYVLASRAAVARIDPVTNHPVAIPASGNLMAFDSGALWLQRANGITLEKVDPNLGKVTGTVAAPTQGRFVAVGRGKGWIVMPDGGLTKMDLPTG